MSEENEQMPESTSVKVSRRQVLKQIGAASAIGIGALAGVSALFPKKAFATTADQLQLDLASSTSGLGDALVNVTQPYGGAVSRTQHDKNADWVSVTDFGTLVANSTGAASANAAVLNAAFSSGYKRIYIPPVHPFTSPYSFYFGSTLNIPDQVVVRGAGSGPLKLTATFTTGNCINLGINARLSGVYISCTSARTSGYSVVLGGNGASIEDFEMDNYYIGIKMVGTVGSRVMKGFMRMPSTTSGSRAIEVDNYSNAVVSDLVITGQASQPSYGITVGHGDTMFISNTNITMHGAALRIAPTINQSCFSVTVTACFFDSPNGHSAAELETAGGNIYNAKFVNCWFGISSTHSGLSMIGAGGTGNNIDTVEIAHCEFHDNADSGLRIHGAGVTNVNVIGGAASKNTTAGVNISGGASDFTIMGMQIGNFKSRGAGNGYGIIVQSGASDNYIISNNRIRGNTTNFSDSGTGTNKEVSTNLF